MEKVLSLFVIVMIQKRNLFVTNILLYRKAHHESRLLRDVLFSFDRNHVAKATALGARITQARFFFENV